jgi:ribosome biogenesis GTPase
MKTGVIIKGIGGFYYVESDGAVYECRARGKFRLKNIYSLSG